MFSEQSNSQFLDVIAIPPNMIDGRRNNIPPTQTFKHSRIREINWGLVYGRVLESIIKHIGIMDEDDLEVFDNALDDRLVSTSPTPSRIEDWTLILNLKNTLSTSTHDTKNMEDHWMFDDGRCEVKKIVSIWEMKSFAQRKTQQCCK